jgi:plastocyanin
MYRPLALIAVPLAALAVAACGGSSHKTHVPANTSPPPATTTSPPAATTPTTDQPSATSAGATVNLAADPSGQLKYTQSRLSTKAGKVTIDFTNRSPLPHDVVLIDSASYSTTAKDLGKTPIFQGGTKTITLTLTPGTYYFYCSVPGHRQAGMQGTLTVS